MEYNLKNNLEFMEWYLEIKKYTDYKIIDLDNIINYFINWYLIKYPDNEIYFYDGNLYMDSFSKSKTIDIMNINDLFRYLDSKFINLFINEYEGKNYFYPKIINNEVIWEKEVLFNIKDYLKNDYYIVANPKTGLIEKTNFITEFSNLNLEQLVLILKNKYNDKFIYKEIENSVIKHHINSILLDKILSIVYSELKKNNHSLENIFLNDIKKYFNIDLISSKKIKK